MLGRIAIGTMLILWGVGVATADECRVPTHKGCQIISTAPIKQKVGRHHFRVRKPIAKARRHQESQRQLSVR